MAGIRGFVFVFSTSGRNVRANKEGYSDDGHMLRRGDVDFFQGSTYYLDLTMWG